MIRNFCWRAAIRGILLSLSIISIFIQAVNIEIGFTLKPFHIMAVVDLLYIVISHANVRWRLVVSEKWFLVFYATMLASIPFSIDHFASMKHAAGVAVLFASFYVFRIFFMTFEKTVILKRFEIISFAYLAVTLSMYVAGAFTLGFDFQRENIDILGITVDREMPRLISLSYNDPNITAVYAAVPLTYFLSLSGYGLKKIMGIVGFTLLIVLTVSRGAFVAIVAMLVAYVILLYLRKRHTTKPFQAFFITIFDRLGSSFADSGSGRIFLWRWAFEAFLTNPIFGIGAGNMPLYNKMHHARLAPAHNSYIDVLAEQGIVGLLGYMSLLAAIFKTCLKTRKKTVFPLLYYIFFLVSQIFLSLAMTDLLFVGLLIAELSSGYAKKEQNRLIVSGGLLRRPQKSKNEGGLPIISFIVPVYNVEKYVKRCVDSLLAQTGLPVEIILVDDGSTDGSSEICRSYAKDYGNVHYYRTKNSGLSAARNYGIKKASGQYLWFVDSDDFVVADAVMRVKKYLAHDVVTIGYYNYYADDDISDGSDAGVDDPIANYYLNPAMAQLKIVKREVFLNNGLAFERGRSYEDVGLMYSIPNYTSDIVHCGERLYFYRRRTGSITQNASDKNVRDHMWAIEKLTGESFGKKNDAVAYQIMLQVLFTAFDLNGKMPHRNAYFDGLRDDIVQLSRHNNYRKNVYLAKSGAKNFAYRLYLDGLVSGRYWFCTFLNKLRKINVVSGD